MTGCRIVLTLLALLIASVFVLGQENRAENRISATSSRKIHQREQWFAQGRVSAREPAAAARYRALRQKMALRAIRSAQTPSPDSPGNAISGDWVQLGPAPVISDVSGVGLQDYSFVAGRATTVAIDSADSTGNTVYVGGAFGGVWKSTNAGPLSSSPGSVAWVPLTDSQATLAVGSIAIQPQLNSPDPAKSVVLVGTGETNGSGDSYYGLGILRSTDAGNTWTLIAHDSSLSPRSFAGLGFSKIAFSTNNPGLVIAAASGTAEGVTEGKENPADANRGIYYSIDSGASWNYAIVKDGSAIADPASVSDVVYNAAAGEFFAAVSLHGTYSSADGINWSRLATQPGALGATSCPAHIASPNVCPLYRGELTVVPSRPGPVGKGEMYAWYVDSNDNDGGIWTSTDGGMSWTQLNESGITSCGDLFGGCGTEQGTYNLALVAVPNGTATDLYAGAVNLYKCTISVISPNCGGAGSGTFINLTHVYGCSSIAKVHPAQHSMAFMLINNNAQDVMYFANDGGLYRALDGYTGLVGGTCGENNSFDSLNGTLGSLTQLVSFSESTTQSPSPDILLAGAQANGSPGTVSAQSSTTWQNVNAGDGGYTAISPDDDTLWFVSNPPDSVSSVNIFKCGSGINCRTQDFQSNEIVSGTTLGGDAGAFNTPFILDPQNSGEMIVGTCRVWRGPSSGGSFSDLSFDFETGGTGICSGAETNLVRAIAAGGAKDANGFSNVIYAGTGGTGPLSTGLPTGGHIWVSTNVSGGSSTWTDQTGAINPGHFPISSIAIDNSDLSGLTAYVGIMGFGVPHIWKTTTGGVSWVDFTANLPDAPVNALLMDTPSGLPSTIYAGTDVGVFASGTGTASWAEVGPAPSSNNPGYLPNVAVTALNIFDPLKTRRLRASTYGRGLWELSRFNLSRPVPDAVTVGAPGTSVPVTLQLTASSGVVVNLSCGALTFAQCSFFGGGSSVSVNVGPASPLIVTLTVVTTAAAPGGPFVVAIHAASEGRTTQTQNLPVTVIGGFNFSVNNTSGPQAVIAGQSATYNLNVVPSSGVFSNPVALTFAGCPAASTCSLSASQIPAGNGATAVTMTIATSAGTPRGTYSPTVTGTLGSLSVSTALALTVQNSTFSFSMSNSGPPSIVAGSSGKYEVTVTPSAGTFPNPVALSFTGCPAAATCSFDTAVVPAGSETANAFLTVATSAGTAAGPYTIALAGTSGALTAGTTISLTVTTQASAFSFSMNSSGPPTITAGSSAKYDISVTPSSGIFPNSVNITFTGCPAVSTCSLSSSLIASGSGPTDVFITIVTTPPARRSETRALLYSLWLPLPGLVIVFGGVGSVRARWIMRTLLMLLMLALCSGCGGLQGGSAAPAGNPGTPVGVYTVTVIGTSGSLTASTTISLTVQTAR